MHKKLNYLNVGCGEKYHLDWTNVDIYSEDPNIISHNLLEGIPFENERFDVVYHSQVLEHFTKEKAFVFLKECYRVLKKDGIIRVVVPDLENVVDEYKRLLTENLTTPSKVAQEKYEWILLELFDQMVRHESGGRMAEFLLRKDLIAENYLLQRIGAVGQTMRKNIENPHNESSILIKRKFIVVRILRKIYREFLKLFKKQRNKSKEFQIGEFRLSGEVHLYAYDRFSLPKLLQEVGFKDVRILNPFESQIPNWKSYELDVKGEMIVDPMALFVEARK